VSFTLTSFDSREAWLEGRWGVGASEIAAVVGLSRYSSPLTLWARKRDVIEPDPDNLSMAFGRRIESLVLDLFAEQTGLHVERYPLAIARSTSTPWAFCSPDGIVWEGKHEPGSWEAALGPVEAKSTSRRVDFDDPESEVAARWLAQVQWQLFVLGMERGWLAVLDSFRDEGHVEQIERDAEAIDWLLDEATTFWKHVESGEPPPAGPHEASFRTYPAMFRAVEGESVEIDRELAERLVAAKREVARAEWRYSEVRGEVLDRLRIDDETSAEQATVDGRTLVRYKPSRTLDVERITAEHDVSAFMVESFDVKAWEKANRKAARDYRTVIKARPFVVVDLDLDGDEP
jgi:putative phage-type endonuclease